VRIRRGADQLGDIAASECVDDGGAVAGGGDDVRTAQYRQLLGDAGWLDIDLGEQVAHRLRPVLDQFENPDPHRMADIQKNSALPGSGAGDRTSFRHCLSFSQYSKLKPPRAGKGTG
jgi:hypothetical protein